MLHQTIPLSTEYTVAVRGPLGLAPSVPVRPASNFASGR